MRRKDAQDKLAAALPCVLEIERECLKAIWLSAEAANMALGYLDTGDFLAPQHAQLFLALRLLHVNGVKFQESLGLVLDVLKHERADWTAAQLAELLSGHGLAANVHWYCDRLREFRCRRAAVGISLELVKLAHEEHPGLWCAAALAKAGKLKQHVDALEERRKPSEATHGT